MPTPAGPTPVGEHVQLVLFTVADTAAQEQLITDMGEQVEAWVAAQPGFVSSTFHKSPDGHRVANYAVWRGRNDWEAFTRHTGQAAIHAAIEAAGAVADKDAGGSFVVARRFRTAGQSDADTFVDPGAQRVLDEITAAAAANPSHPASEADHLVAIREGYAGATSMAGAPEPVAHVRNAVVHHEHAAVPVRLYDPRQDLAPGAPVLLWLHGGSFVAGGLDTHDGPLRALANRTGFPVVSAAWRLAPENPYPAGLDDAIAVLAWLAAGGGEAPAIDPARIFVGGDSAGGALVAVLTQRARQSGPRIAGQMLIYPNTDLAGDGSAYPSWSEHDGRILQRADMERNFRLYAQGADLADPGLSPLRAGHFGGLPPALVVTGEADPQRDEGELYARCLSGAGVPVEAMRVGGMIHGFMQMAGTLPAGAALIDTIAAWLRRQSAGTVWTAPVTVGR